MLLQDHQITVHGLPIRPAFSQKLPAKRKLRKQLGMDLDKPAVLLVGESARLCREALGLHQSKFWILEPLCRRGGGGSGQLRPHAPHLTEGQQADSRVLLAALPLTIQASQRGLVAPCRAAFCLEMHSPLILIQCLPLS